MNTDLISSGPRALIVEDETHLAKGLQFNLEAEGHSVAVVGDGESALELLLGDPAKGKRSDFDAVVLDVMLPGKDGFTVAAELRAAKQFVPVLMLTARGRPEDVLKGFASGAFKYQFRTVSDLNIRVYGDTAVVTGRSVQKGVENGKDYSGDYWFTRVYVRQNGAWTTVALQTTLIQH